MARIASTSAGPGFVMPGARLRGRAPASTANERSSKPMDGLRRHRPSPVQARAGMTAVGPCARRRHLPRRRPLHRRPTGLRNRRRWRRECRAGPPITSAHLFATGYSLFAAGLRRRISASFCGCSAEIACAMVCGTSNDNMGCVQRAFIAQFLLGASAHRYWGRPCTVSLSCCP